MAEYHKTSYDCYNFALRYITKLTPNIITRQQKVIVKKDYEQTKSDCNETMAI